MKRLVRAGLAAGLMLAAGGCAPVYYVPNTHNVPMLEERGDATFALNLASFGAEFQGAYAITNHVGVMLNAASMRQKDDNDGDGGSGSLAELGLGYYRKLGSNVSWENYLLLGGGTVENHFPSTKAAAPATTGNLEAKFTRFGVQPSLSVHSRIVDSAVSLRLSGVNYSDVSGGLIYQGQDQVAYLNSLGTQFMIEPALTFRLGFNPIKLQLQLGWSKNVTTSGFRQREGYVAIGGLFYWRH
jgi:hypothetical protein